MFQRWKTTGFTAFLWKTIGGALRGHRSGNRALAGKHGRATANRPVGAHSRRGAPCFSAGPSLSLTARVNRARAGPSLRYGPLVTRAAPLQLRRQIWPAGAPGQPVRTGRPTIYDSPINRSCVGVMRGVEGETTSPPVTVW